MSIDQILSDLPIIVVVLGVTVAAMAKYVARLFVEQQKIAEERFAALLGMKDQALQDAKEEWRRNDEIIAKALAAVADAIAQNSEVLKASISQNRATELELAKFRHLAGSETKEFRKRSKDDKDDDVIRMRDRSQSVDV